MVNVLATCPTCGEQDVDVRRVRLVTCSVEAWSFYTFVCPVCGETVRKEAGEAVVRLLRYAGIAAESWHVPAEALEPHVGPPLDHDDVLDLVLGLRGDAFLGELLDAPR